jgi:hypothetical protein
LIEFTFRVWVFDNSERPEIKVKGLYLQSNTCVDYNPVKALWLDNMEMVRSHHQLAAPILIGTSASIPRLQLAHPKDANDETSPFIVSHLQRFYVSSAPDRAVWSRSNGEWFYWD